MPDKPIVIRLFEHFFNLFYPACCSNCGKLLLENEKTLCLPCSFRLPCTQFHLETENMMTERLEGRFPFEQATAYLYFSKTGMVQKLIHSLKYHHRPGIGRYLGSRFGSELNKHSWTENIDYLIPVPLHPRKERSRGFNQVYLIAREFSQATGIPVLKRQLLKIKQTDSQTHKTIYERIENLKGAFRVKNPEALKNKHILLLDDVMTTGATLEACALSLVNIEGLKIHVATLALATEY